MTTRPFALVDTQTGRVLSRHATEALAFTALTARQRNVARRLNFGGSQAGVSADRFAPLGVMDLRKAECESIRGEWGEICPDCHQRLPFLPGPLMARVPPINGRPARPHAFGINR